MVQSLFDANLENLYNKPISRIYPTHIVQTKTLEPSMTSTATTTRENTLKPFPTNTLLATRTPSFTPVPIHLGAGYSEYGWPLLMHMPEEITVNKNHSMHVLKPAISKYIDTFDTTLLFAYQKGKLSENLTLFLSKLFPSSFNFSNCVSGALCWQTPPGVNLPDGDLSEYVIEEASSSELCQFMEAGTLEGYGYAKVEKYGSVESALTYLSKRFGNPDHIEDSYKFYCSNFDPDSEDFLSIAVMYGYGDLVLELLSGN